MIKKAVLFDLDNKVALFKGHKEGLISFGSTLEEAYDTIIKYYGKVNK